MNAEIRPESGKPHAELIACTTCGVSIAAAAQACPKCGAPNDWVHPQIAAFLAKRDQLATKRRFNYWHDKTSLWGETMPKSPWWGKVLALLAGYVASAYSVAAWGLIWAMPIAGIVLGLVMKLTARRETFRADFKTGQWRSNNEQFWLPVRSVLKL